MRILLDTHAFLWWTSDSPELTDNVRAIIADETTECWLSLASCWEMAIKISLGKLRLSAPLERFIPEQLAANGIRLLNIDFRHIGAVEDLPFHHRDPFDRLLVAQALAEDLVLVTKDNAFTRYEVKCVW